MAAKRKRLFVDRSVQGSILLRIALHFALFLITSEAFLYFVELIGSAPQDATQSMVERLGPTALAVLILTPMFVRDLCKLTNRFAGPMVRLRRAIHDLAEGREVTPIHFREEDFWKELAVDFNQVLARLESAESSRDHAMAKFAAMEQLENV